MLVVFIARVATSAVAALDWALDALERRRQRRQLAGLDDRILHDIGLSRADAEAETAKPWWRA